MTRLIIWGKLGRIPKSKKVEEYWSRMGLFMKDSGKMIVRMELGDSSISLEMCIKENGLREFPMVQVNA